MIGRFCAAVTMNFNALASGFTELSEQQWVPQKGWIYVGRAHTVILGKGGSNAVKFTPNNGRIGLDVRANLNENSIIFTILDTSIGIQEDDLARLFHPFVQLDSDLARQTTGTGLGLALVAQMERLHGGSIRAESQRSEGRRFSIVLPWASTLTADTSSRMKISGKFRTIRPGDQNQKRTILLAEDTDEVIMVIRDYLEYMGYQPS